MSNTTIITIQEIQIRDFVSIEHGMDYITLTFNKWRIGQTEILLTPDQARQIAKELLRRADEVEKMKEGK